MIDIHLYCCLYRCLCGWWRLFGAFDSFRGYLLYLVFIFYLNTNSFLSTDILSFQLLNPFSSQSILSVPSLCPHRSVFSDLNISSSLFDNILKLCGRSNKSEFKYRQNFKELRVKCRCDGNINNEGQHVKWCESHNQGGKKVKKNIFSNRAFISAYWLNVGI